MQELYKGPSLAKMPFALGHLAGPSLESLRAACEALRLVCQGYTLTENGFCEEEWMGTSPQQQQGAGLSDMLGWLLSGLLGAPQLPVPKTPSPQQVHKVLSSRGFPFCMASIFCENLSLHWTDA